MFATLELSAAPSDAARRVSEAAAALDAAGREALDRLLGDTRRLAAAPATSGWSRSSA